MGGVPVPLTVEQVLELLESVTSDPPLISPATILCRVEDLLLSGTGATSVNAFLVDRWFNKLLHFSSASCSDDDGEGQGAQEAAGASGAPCADGGTGRGSQGQTQTQQQQQHHRQHEIMFDARAVCDIGEGIAGMAAKTGRKLRIRDCSTQHQRRRGESLYSTDYDSGSLVCWPVLERLAFRKATPTGTEATSTSAELEDVDWDNELAAGPPPDSTGVVLALMQVHCADGELSAEAVEFLRCVGRLLVPLLTEALTRDEEYVRRRSTEALLSLSNISPKDMGLIDMVEELVRLAQVMTEAERVCLFFVDDAADELWVAKSVDFQDAKIKIGEGLCGYAAATGGTVNVIDSYKDSRFDRQWDKQTGFVTKSVLCVPIPPPDNCTLGPSPAAAGGGTGRWAGQHGPQSQGDATHVHKNGCAPSWMPVALDDSQSQQKGSESAETATTPTPRRRRSSRLPARPLAVLQVINKRGKGIFTEHDEDAVVRLCARVELLLRNKAAEVALLWSGMTERSNILQSKYPGGDGGASSNCARVESTIMRLYSEAPFPADTTALGEQRGPSCQEASAPLGEGGDSGGSGRRNSTSHCSSVASTDIGQGDEEGYSERGRSRSFSDVYAAAATAAGGKGPSSSPGDGCGKGVVGRLCSAESAQEESELVDLSMNLFDLCSEHLLSLVGRFFRSMGLVEIFEISEQKMQSFLRGVEQRYRPNSFHNLTHAVSVTHASFTIVRTTEINTLLRPLDKLALLVSAFCHDIDHPGNNNAYEVNSLSPLALQHGDSSVLERHHVFVAYQVLLEEGGANNIFSELTRAQFREVRQTIVQAILCTDMSGHMKHCADVFQFAQKAKKLAAGGDRWGWREALAPSSIRHRNKRAGRSLSPAPTRISGMAGAADAEARRWKGRGSMVISAPVDTDFPAKKRSNSVTVAFETPSLEESRTRAIGRSTPPPPPPRHVFSVDKAEDRLFLTRTILHCADLSGQVLEIQLALEWGKRILEEFRLQAELEDSAGLPLTVVGSGDLETTMKGQHFFATKIVKPLWEPFAVLFPKLNPLLENLNNNCDYYYQEGLRLEQQRLSEAAASASSPQSPHPRGEGKDGTENRSEWTTSSG